MTEPVNERAREILRNSKQIYSAEKVQQTITEMASRLNHDFALSGQTPPLVLSVMGGAAIFTGQLLPHLNFPLEFDFIHVSRYGNEEYGGEFIWKVIPRQNVINRIVIVLDDILDEGQTLLHVREKLLDMGAAKVFLAVFAEKKYRREQTCKSRLCRSCRSQPVYHRFRHGYSWFLAKFARYPDIDKTVLTNSYQ